MHISAPQHQPSRKPKNMHDDNIERSAGVWTGLSQPVSSGRRPFYRSAVQAAVVQRNICSGLLSWFWGEFQEFWSSKSIIDRYGLLLHCCQH